jgi:NAD(P)-dependent dehydrogenase (short-subunit alcohol dehydrogenase family)
VTADLAGTTAVVTGGNAGLGYFASEQLAARGARVVIACRNSEKGRAAVTSIERNVRGAEVLTVPLDLASLSSVEAAVRTLTGLGPIHALVANAGVTSSKAGDITSDGFEIMFGTNHLGHFALIAGLLPALAEGPSRIVHLGSISHRFYRLDLDDPMGADGYQSFRAYARSKLAVMTFAFELDRRLREAGSDAQSVVAHPGFSIDQLAPDRPGITPRNGAPTVLRAIMRSMVQGKDAGARPTVHAATDPYLRGGEYVGPSGWQQLTGAPTVRKPKPWARDRAIAVRLWSLSEGLTGTRIDL